MLSQVELAGYAPAPLEDWYRHNYFHNEIDISGSGVEDYTFAQARKLAGIQLAEFDAMVMGDAPTVGTEATRRVIAERFTDGNPAKVMLANGSNEALQLVVRSLLDPGDEVIVPRPCYHCHDKIATAIGCHVKYWDLHQDGHFKADLAALSRLVGAKTKALILNFPNNPTGVTLGQEDIDRIIDLCRSLDIYLVWDAAFQEIVYEAGPLVDPVSLYDKAVSVGTFSKVYGLPGLRFGWLVGDEKVLAGCIRQKDFGNLYVSPLIEHIARKVLLSGDAFTLPRVAQARKNRDVVDAWMRQDGARMAWDRPGGGVCGLVKVPQQFSDRDFCNKLLAECGVLLVPGSVFEAPGYARLGFGGNSAKLTEGIGRLDNFLRKHA